MKEFGDFVRRILRSVLFQGRACGCPCRISPPYIGTDYLSRNASDQRSRRTGLIHYGAGRDRRAGAYRDTF